MHASLRSLLLVEPRPVLDLDFTNPVLDDRITFARASAGGRYNSQGSFESVASGVPRFDYNPLTNQIKGLLLEDQRTNLDPNFHATGAVVGSPGTVPTGWGSAIAAAGLAVEIVGVGTEDGIGYVDYRIFGTTASSPLTTRLRFSVNITVSASQQYYASSFCYFIAGSLTNVTEFAQRITKRNSGALVNDDRTAFTVTSATRLSAARRSHTATVPASGVNQFDSEISVITGTGAVDVTVRVGGPQLELGTFMSSPISTAGSSATRAADTASITGLNFNRFYRQSEGTFVASLIPGPLMNLANRVFDTSDSTTLQTQFIYRNNSTSDYIAQQFSDPATIYVGTAQAGRGPGNIDRVALAYSNNRVCQAVNGIHGSRTTTIGNMALVNRLDIGDRYDGTRKLNGWIRSLRYYNRRLQDAKIMDLTR